MLFPGIDTLWLVPDMSIVCAQETKSSCSPPSSKCATVEISESVLLFGSCHLNAAVCFEKIRPSFVMRNGTSRK